MLIEEQINTLNQFQECVKKSRETNQSMLSNFLSFFFSSFSYHLVHYTGTGKLWKSRYVCSPEKTFIPREGFGDFGFMKISLQRGNFFFFFFLC